MNPLEKAYPKMASAEKRPPLPELIANPPLKETSLIYSVPVRGEWKNGNILRLLYAMFAQRLEKGRAYEIEFIANDDGEGDLLDPEDENTFLSDKERLFEQKRAETARDTQDAVTFLKKVVFVQGLIQQIQDEKTEAIAQEKITKLLEKTSDSLERHVLQQAANKAKSVSIALIDATNMDIRRSDYKIAGIGFARTLGADLALARFEDHEEIALALFDADSIPENTSTVRHIQSLFSQQPGLTYVFFGMTDILPKGVSRDFASQIRTRRHLDYNRYYGHGSPQICFRLRAYRKLREISHFLILGDEDRDTAVRLIYHFGRLQDGLLFEMSQAYLSSSPTHLTSDRQDGSVDGRPDRNTGGVPHALEEDFQEILNFQKSVLSKINQLPEEKREQALITLRRARDEQHRKQRIQQRFNRIVARSFIHAIEDRMVFLGEDQTIFTDEVRLLRLTGGRALQMYIRNNTHLIKEILSSPEDIQMIRYLIGLELSPPEEIDSLTPFQYSLREYLGDVVSCTDMEEAGLYEISTENSVEGAKSSIQDKRTSESRVSFLHSMMAELLALGHTYRALFQTQDFLATREDDRRYLHRWPKNPDEQVLDYSYGDMEVRVKKLKTGLINPFTEKPREPEPIIPHSPTNKQWWSYFSFRCFPVFELFKRLKK